MGKLFVSVGGGGVDTDVVTAGASDVLAGKVIVGPDGEPLTGTLALSGNATTAQVLTGNTFYNTDAKSKLTGTMANQGAQTFTFTPSSGTQTCKILAGYHNGSGVVTCNAIPSTYIAVSSANFFKNGALGALSNLGIVAKAPQISYTTGSAQSSGTWDGSTFISAGSNTTLVVPATNNITSGRLVLPWYYRYEYTNYPKVARYTSVLTFRKSVNLTNVKAICFDFLANNSNVETLLWAMETSTNKYVARYCGSLIDGIYNLDVSSLKGYCVFGMRRCGGRTDSVSVHVNEISLRA